MSRFQYTNRNLELLEPYEWKRSRTVLRGESGSNVADLPDKPSELEQRNGRTVRKGNKVAKEYAGNKVDTYIYAAENSLDAYKFNLLHNKQLFIRQLKTNSLNTRTIDEGAIDEEGGMNFSEYIAILSGNTDLLEKTKLEKKIAVLQSEYKAYSNSRDMTESRLFHSKRQLEEKKDRLEGLIKDWDYINKVAPKDKNGNRPNPVKLGDLKADKPEDIGKVLQRMAKKEHTYGQYKTIGSLFDFKLVMKTETIYIDGISKKDNKFFVEGALRYSFNNGRLAYDPVLAANNFINALDKIPGIMEKYRKEITSLEKDIPVMQEIVNTPWKKTDELKGLKADLTALEKRIQESLSKPALPNQPDKKEDIIELPVAGKDIRASVAVSKRNSKGMKM